MLCLDRDRMYPCHCVGVPGSALRCCECVSRVEVGLEMQHCTYRGPTFYIANAAVPVFWDLESYRGGPYPSGAIDRWIAGQGSTTNNKVAGAFPAWEPPLGNIEKDKY